MITFHTGHQFAKSYLKKRTKPVQHIVCHWTGGEGSGVAVFNTLKNRTNAAGKKLGLSIDFIVDGEGNVYSCNPDIDNLYTQHAGIINSTSVGIEIVNYGIAKTPPKKGADRVVDTQVIHGRKQQVARFRPAQVEAVYGLCRHLCERFGLPFEVLGGTTTAPVAEFRGIIGHFHVNRLKNDPGPLLLSQLKDKHHTETQEAFIEKLATDPVRPGSHTYALPDEDGFETRVVTEDGSYTVRPHVLPETLPTASLWQRMVDVVTGWCR